VTTAPTGPTGAPDPDLEEHLFGAVSERPPAPKVRVARERVEVQLGPDLARVVDECVAAIAQDPRTFCRANGLVTVIGAPPDAPRSAVAPGTPIIRTLAPATILERLSVFARILRWNDKKGGWFESTAPESVVAAMVARGDWPAVRPLVGVVEVPLFRPDGTVRQERGYDAATGYVYLPSADYPTIPDHPSQADACRALALLEDIFSDFPHVDRAHKMVPIAAILTILARAAIDGPVPAFLFDASTRGSGKTRQANVVHIIAFGRHAAINTYPEKDEELDKLLASLANAGARAVLLDNLTRTFGGGSIDAYLSTPGAINFRILGVTETRALPWLAVMMVSGNNLVIGEDAARRVLMSRIESPLERPEDRTDFKYRLPEDAFLLRPKLVTAALTILRAYAAKGRPDAGVAPWGTFEAWSRLVPHAIVFAGGADPQLARPRAESANDAMRAHAVLLEMLPRVAPGGTTARELVRLLYPSGVSEEERESDGFSDLREAIETMVPTRPGQTPSSHALGKALRSRKGRVIGGRRLVVVDESGKRGHRWSVA
jgi:hypothetical protein